jgi:hypothetical protein
MINMVQPKDKTMLSANTYSEPALATSAPATSRTNNPRSIHGNGIKSQCSWQSPHAQRDPGTIAAKTRQRIARPIPLVKVRNKSNEAFQGIGRS